MTEICVCSQPGLCSRHDMDVMNHEWIICQRRGCEIAGRVIAGRVDLSEQRNCKAIEVQPILSDVGTRIRESIEKATGITITCGTCKTYLNSLNKTTEHDHESIVQKLYAEISWPLAWREHQENIRQSISDLVSPIVPKGHDYG